MQINISMPDNVFIHMAFPVQYRLTTSFQRSQNAFLKIIHCANNKLIVSAKMSNMYFSFLNICLNLIWWLTPEISAVTGCCLKTKLQINQTPGNDHMHVVVCCCKGSQLSTEQSTENSGCLYLSIVVRVSAFLGGSKSSNWIESANHMFVTATTASIVWWFTFQSRLTCALRSFTSGDITWLFYGSWGLLV